MVFLLIFTSFFFYILFFVGGSPETQRLQSDIFSISVIFSSKLKRRVQTTRF